MNLALLFLSVSHTFHLPEGLLNAVCFVESSHDIRAVSLDDGGSSSIGVCQIKMDTARGLGFKGTARQLQDPSVNTYYAGYYLYKQLDRYNGSVFKAVCAYNAGHYRLNEYGEPINMRYINKVYAAWSSNYAPY